MNSTPQAGKFAEPGRTYTAPEISEFFRVGTETVWRKCRNREWPHMRIGRHYRFSAENISEIQQLLAPQPVSRAPRSRKRQPL
ncbi:helix-turn-helix domain-containing protein [Arthrobacter sp. RCC_34]|uniref:helix-turn-helix domain-containing protein n=1 Tax=Arthrobacter sp. RCC_34 TaxID=3239230 RepID=UPI00352330C6